MRVESREERVESSAWSLCSGLPLSTAKIAVPIRGQSGIYTGTHGDSAVRARPSAPTTHYFLPSSPYSLEKSSGLPLSTAKIAVPIRGQSGIYTGTHGDSAVRARPSAPTTHYFLPSSPYSLEKSSGLPLSTAKIAVPIRGQSGIYTGTHGGTAVRAHPSAPTTHYLLPSSPSSLEKSSGLPLSTAKIAVPIRGQSGIYTGTHGGTAVRAHPSAPYTHFFLPYEELFVSIRGSVIPPFRVFRVFRGSFPPQ